MAEQERVPLSERLGIPRVMMWTGLVASIAVFLMLLITRAEAVQGQVADLPAMFMVVVALAAGTAVSTTDASRRLVDVATRPRSLVVISLVVFVVLAIGTLLVFGTTPLSSDEKDHLFQARLFAQFKITADYPADLVGRIVPPGFQDGGLLVTPDGRVMSILWPGWALLMTPFVWLGAPWLLGPAMAALGIYLVGRLATLISGARAAAVAILLAVTSGAFLVTGMSVYPSGGHMTLSLLYAWLLLRGGRRDTVLAGIVGGLALNLNNPVPHAAFALPWLIWLAADRTRRTRLVWLAAGYAPWLVVFVGWYLETSSLEQFWQSQVSQAVSLPTPGILWWRFWELVRAWAWSAPGLLLLAILGWKREQVRSAAWILGACFGMMILAYAFFPHYQGLGWGARYYQTAWGALPILAALLLVRPGMEALTRVVVVAALAGLVLVVPIQIVYAHGLAVDNQAAEASVQAIYSPGVDLYFINVGPNEDSSITLWDDPSLTGRLVFVSQGQTADQQLVDRWFPGSRLVVSNSSGSGYHRP
jgi:hypothetical protein